MNIVNLLYRATSSSQSCQDLKEGHSIARYVQKVQYHHKDKTRNYNITIALSPCQGLIKRVQLLRQQLKIHQFSMHLLLQTRNLRYEKNRLIYLLNSLSRSEQQLLEDLSICRHQMSRILGQAIIVKILLFSLKTKSEIKVMCSNHLISKKDGRDKRCKRREIIAELDRVCITHLLHS